MSQKHKCAMDTPDDAYGSAIDICSENDDGMFWVSNGEYASQVNYCPYCGVKAPKQVGEKSEV